MDFNKEKCLKLMRESENLPHVNRSESFPKSPENMLGLVDIFDVPKSEKSIIENSVRNNSRNNSSVIFLNNKTNI